VPPRPGRRGVESSPLPFAEELAERYVQVADLSNKLLQQAEHMLSLTQQLRQERERLALADARIAEQEREHGVLLNSYEALRTEFETMKSYAADAREFRAQAEAESARSAALCAEFEDRLKQRDLANAERLARLETDVHSSDEIDKKLRSEITALSSKVARLERQLSQEAAINSDLKASREALSSKCQTLEERLLSVEKQRNEFRRQTQEKEAALAAAKLDSLQRVAEIQRLTDRLNAECTENLAAQAALDTAKREVLLLLPLLKKHTRTPVGLAN
jgi:chromosome segregation ATPase